MDRMTKEKCIRILKDMEKFKTINQSDISPLVSTILPRLLNVPVEKVPPSLNHQGKLKERIKEIFEELNEGLVSVQAFIEDLESFKETHLEEELLDDLSKRVLITQATLVHLTSGLEDDEIDSLIEVSIL